MKYLNLFLLFFILFLPLCSDDFTDVIPEESTEITETIAIYPLNFYHPFAGTAENPYLISSLNNLRWLSETREAWGSEYQSIYYRQTADIDASETINWNNGEGFRPIGQVSSFIHDYFYGEYDGGNFVIDGLFINPHRNIVYQESVGFFAGILNSRLLNIRLENISIAAQFDIGAITALAFNSSILNCSVSGVIQADENTFAVGTLIGRADSTLIEFCSSTAMIFGKNNEDGYSVIGGLIGSMSESDLRNSYFNGIIRRQAINSGGLVGFVANNSHIEFCYITTKEPLPRDNISLMIGENDSFPMNFGAISSSVVNGSSVNNTFFDKQATGVRKGIYLEIKRKFFNKSIRGLRTSQMKRMSIFRRKGWDFEDVWTIDRDINDGFPSLIDFVGN